MTPLLQNQALDLLELADVAAGSLAGAELHLYTNNLVFDPTTVVIGDLTEATFNTYAAVALTWDAPSVSDDGHAEIMSQQVTFRPTDALVPEDVYGFYVTDAGGDLIAGGTFDGGPLPMRSTLDVSKMTLVYRFGNIGYVDVVT